uniref:HEAT repeat-containing protein 1 n=1 Tax=Panagrellus redivivus TaxID=6233 RepID=A0A7E4ULQ3_PANRE
MPSLSRQLARLKDAPAIAQGVERDYSSLIFDKHEAAALDREQALKVGLAGLAQLKKLLPEVDEISPQLFDESTVNFNRTTIDKEENTKLHETLEHFIAVIAPYFHHQACKQVLEWLIYRYQIHTHEAEFLAIALLPFHDTNSYGRLCSILYLPKHDFAWLKDVTKNGAPIPFGQLPRQCLIAGGNLHLIGAVAGYATQLTKMFAEYFITRNYQFYYVFFVKLISSLFEDTANATDQTLSRIIPHLGVALKSKVLPFKMAGMVLVSQLSMTVTFTPEAIQPILSLLLHKVNPRIFTTVMDTLIVICQRQNLQTLPVNRLYGILKRAKELNFLTYLAEVQKLTDLTGFLVPLWRALFDLTNREVTDDELSTFYSVFELTTESNMMSPRQARDLVALVLELIAAKEVTKLPKVLAHNLKSVILRFADEFDAARAKYIKNKDDQTVATLIEQCKIKSYELGEIIEDKKRKRRRNRNSSTRSANDDEAAPSKEARPDRGEIINATTEALAPKPYRETPITIIFKLASKKWDDAVFMLKSFSRPDYIKRHSTADFESFAVKAISLATSQSIPILSELKAALAYIPISPEFALQLISKTGNQPTPKKRKAVGVASTNEVAFNGESDEQYEKRLTMSLEVLKINDFVTPDARLFAFLFNLIETIVETEAKAKLSAYNLGVIISIFLKYVKDPNSVSSISKSLRLDPIVKVIRFTYDHSVLRNALQILALLAPLMPSLVVTHIMSVFAFMGDGGLIKKDNDLTLSIIEEALHALFSAIMSSARDNSDRAKLNVRRRLLEVSQVFAISLADVPAHRRMRILRAVANTVSPDDVWIIVGAIFDDFCGKWSKATSKKTDVDQLHDITLEFIAEFEPEHQLATAIQLIDYVIEVGPDSPTQQLSRLGKKSKNATPSGIVVFDRTHRSIQKLRHYRFLVFGWVLKFLNYKPLYEQLGALSDDEIYDRMLGVGKKLLITVTNLSDFVDADLALAEKSVKELENAKTADATATNAATQALRYWVALASKTDVICDRMRCLLPANVSGHIICDLLADADDAASGVDGRIRDRALQLLNIKLINQGGFDADGNDIHAEYLIKFAEKLTDWIRPAETHDEITLCQNAAFSLKLVAKRIPPAEGQKVFTRTLEKCVALLRNWSSLDEAMVGNVLLLLGELVRSQDFKATMLNSDGICKILLDILKESESRAAQVIEQIEADRQKAAAALKNAATPGRGGATPNIDAVNTRRQRNTHMSLCGRQYGDDALLLCSLTCSQRLFDFAASYVTTFFERFLHVVSQLSAKYLADPGIQEKATDEAAKEVLASPRLDNIRIRLGLIRTAMSKQELRLFVDPFKNVAIKFAKRPLSLSTVASLIGDSLKAAKSDQVAKVIEELAELFTLLFKFRRNDTNVEKFELYNYAEDAIISAFLTLVDHMKATSLRPMINGFTDHIRNSLTASKAPYESRLMALTVFNFANQFLDSYHSLALPYFVHLFDLGIKILRDLNASKKPANELFIDGTKAGTIHQAQAHRLIILILNFVAKVARHSTFFNEDLANNCYAVIVDELDNYKVEKHEERCLPHLASTIYTISEAYVDLFNREICNRVLLRTRHESAKVRYRATLVFENLVDRIGDSLAPLLPMVVQYLSELLEDTNPKVTAQCEKTIRLLRSKFGDEVLGKE